MNFIDPGCLFGNLDLFCLPDMNKKGVLACMLHYLIPPLYRNYPDIPKNLYHF